MLERADHAARAESDSIRQVSATYADARRRILVANSDGLLVEDDRGAHPLRRELRRRRRHRHADRHRGARAHASASRSSTRSTPRRSPAPPPSARSRCCGPVPRRAGKLPVVLKRGAGGVLFHEACGHGLEADLVEKDASVFRGPRRRAGRVAARHAGRRRHLRARVGHVRDRRRRRARAAQRAHRGRRAHRLHVGPRARPQGRSREQRQRPARDVPAPADGAHDEHVPARRATTTPTTIIRDTPYGLYCVALGGGQVEHRDRRLRVRHHRGVHDRERRDHRAGARRAAHRQRARDAAARRRGRQRLRHLGRHVRQGRPGRAGLVGAADAAGRRADRRRHRR